MDLKKCLKKQNSVVEFCFEFQFFDKVANLQFNRSALCDTLFSSMNSVLRFSDFTTGDSERTEGNRECKHEIPCQVCQRSSLRF
jgi:hypothetical protein